jgi:protein TonB
MSSSISDPNEQVTKVRLIEPTAPDSPKEPPPEHASAISDRDHTALKEKKPKIVTPPKAPLGTVEPFDKRMAALPPPTAPEDLREKKEDRKEDVKEDSRKPKPTPPESLNKPKPKLSDSPSKRDLKNRNVDLRPTIQDLAKGLSGAPGSPDFFPDGEIEEAVVDINTREDRFFSYLLHLKRKIQGVWIYPSVAAKSGLGGSLTVEFSIANTGELLNVNLLDSSGHSILDESAMKAIKSAAPYYPFPSRMRAKKLRVRANFIYVTESFFRNIM